FLQVSAPTETYPLSLHDALPISREVVRAVGGEHPGESRGVRGALASAEGGADQPADGPVAGLERGVHRAAAGAQPVGEASGLGGDRKSTRLNSSHVKISYAVFCL